MNRDLSHDVAPVSRLRYRVFGLAILGAVAVVLVLVVRTAYLALADSWVAPLHLSPQSDAVLQLQVKLAREQAEMARVEADLQRIDGDLAAVDAALRRLAELREANSAPLHWQAGQHAAEQKSLGRVIASLEDEVALLRRLHARQAELTAAAGRDLVARFIDRRELAREEQALDSLALALADKRRLLEQARHERRVATIRTDAYRAGNQAPSTAAGVMPEIAASKEHVLRTELELMRLEAEKRSLVALRRVAEDGLVAQRELLGELKSRPLYRAIDAAVDVAFVPYDQLDGVEAGARVFACVWGLILCEEVGQVSEVLQGEVSTLDPWGEPARGLYAIVDLDDPAAVREKSLRVRP